MALKLLHPPSDAAFVSTAAAECAKNYRAAVVRIVVKVLTAFGDRTHHCLFCVLLVIEGIVASGRIRWSRVNGSNQGVLELKYLISTENDTKCGPNDSWEATHETEHEVKRLDWPGLLVLITWLYILNQKGSLTLSCLFWVIADSLDMKVCMFFTKIDNCDRWSID